jgi:alcohol dehydrogenase
VNGAPGDFPAFDWQPGTRIVSGVGSIERLGALTSSCGERALLVSDPGVVAAGHAARVEELLNAAGVRTTLFFDTHENPTDDDAHRCQEALQTSGSTVVVALGGGSAIDTAKAAILSRGEPFLPLIAVPTTAGTGSEVQRHALISDPKTHVKRAVGAPGLEPTIALLDAELTLTCPPRVTALAGLDALSHAIESQVSIAANPLSKLFSVEAYKLLSPALEKVFSDPTDISARQSVLLGACWAGLAIESSMLGAAHASANPLTARFQIPHGEAVGLMLPHVIAFNAENADYTPFEPAGADAVIARFCALRTQGGLAESLAERSLDDMTIATLAAEATEQRTGHFNPRPLTQEDFAALYRAARE